MSLRRTPWLLTIVLALGIGAAVLYTTRNSLTRSSSTGPQAVHPSMGAIRDVITGKGTVAYVHQVVVKAQRQGRVDQVLVNEGESVRSAQALVHVADVEADVESATRDAERQKVSTRIAALQQDIADLSRLVAAGAVAPYDLSQKRVELDLARKDMEISIQDRERLEINKARATVRSPFAGIVVSLPVAVGQWVASGEELLTVSGGSSRNIVAYVDATDMARLSIGQEVAFSDQPDNSSLRQGKVASISRVVDASQRQNSVRVLVEPAASIDDLRLSQQLYLEFIVRSAASVLRVPKDYVHHTEKGAVVYVADERGVRARPVNIASGDRNFDQVISGLDVKDHIMRQANGEGQAR